MPQHFEEHRPSPSAATHVDARNKVVGHVEDDAERQIVVGQEVLVQQPRHELVDLHHQVHPHCGAARVAAEQKPVLCNICVQMTMRVWHRKVGRYDINHRFPHKVSSDS